MCSLSPNYERQSTVSVSRYRKTPADLIFPPQTQTKPVKFCRLHYGEILQSAFEDKDNNQMRRPNVKEMEGGMDVISETGTFMAQPDLRWNEHQLVWFYSFTP